MSPHLSLLGLLVRRGLPPWTWVALPAAVVVAGARFELETTVLAGAHASLTGGLAAQGRWAAALLFGGPLLVVGAARAGALWRRGWCRWLGVLPVGRGSIAGHLLGGSLAGLLLVLVLATGAVALSTSAASGGTHLHTLAHPALVLPRGDVVRTLALPPLAERAFARGACLWIRPTAGPGAGVGESLGVRLLANGATPSAPARWLPERRLFELDLPPVPMPLRLELRREGGAAFVLLPGDSIALVETRPRPALLAALRMALRIGLWLGPWVFLSLGLGAWLRPGLAAGIVLALGLQQVPGSALAQAWEWLGRGLSPAWASPGEGLALLASMALAAVLVRASFEQEGGLP